MAILCGYRNHRLYRDVRTFTVTSPMRFKINISEVGKPEGKRPLGRPRRRWEDNIKMNLQEMGGSCGDWMELAPDRVRWRANVSTVMNLRVP